MGTVVSRIKETRQRHTNKHTFDDYRLLKKISVTLTAIICNIIHKAKRRCRAKFFFVRIVVSVKFHRGGGRENGHRRSTIGHYMLAAGAVVLGLRVVVSQAPLLLSTMTAAGMFMLLSP